MIRSLSCAFWCILVMKQRSNCGHFWPVQGSRERRSWPKRTRLGQLLISARSPVSVRLLPLADAREIVDLLQAVQQRFLLRVVDLLAACVVGAAFHVASAQRSEMLLQERDVLVEELLLQILRTGGDHDARPERIAGTRYASVLPVPVPASTIRCFCRPARSPRPPPFGVARPDIRSWGATRKAVPFGQRTASQ